MSIFDAAIKQADENMEEMEKHLTVVANEKEKKAEVINFEKNESKKKELDEESTDLLFRLIEYFTNQDPQTLTKLNRNLLTKDEFMNIAKKQLHQMLVREKMIPIVLEKLRRYLWGYYILEDLINDDSISDIKVLSWNNIRIKRKGERMGSNVHFKDENDFKRFVGVVATKNQVNISDVNAIQTFTDKNNNDKNILRFDITTELVNSTEAPYLIVRKIPKIKNTISRLIEDKMMDENTAQYLIDQAKNASGIIFCGKGASGKTTIMNALLEYIPHNRSGLVME